MKSIKLLLFIFALTFSQEAVAQNPANISEQPMLWLKADVGVTEINGKVSQWIDQSGNAFQLNQSSPDQRPAIKSLPNGGNIGQAVYFDGNDVLLKENGILGNLTYDEIEIFVVSQSIKPHPQEGFEPGFFYNEAVNTDGHFRAHLPWSNNSIYFSFGSYEDDESVNTTMPRLQEYELGVINSYTAADIQKIKYNTGAIVTENGGNSFTGKGADFWLGGQNNLQNFFRGYVSEIIIFPKRLSSTERTQVYNYLDLKYQIVTKPYPISSLDPFSIRRGVPDHYYLDPNRWDNSAYYDEWVYWKRSGKNKWNVDEKVNMRVMPPQNYDPEKAEGYPVVFFFSGCGEQGRNRCGFQIPYDNDQYDNNNLQLGYVTNRMGHSHSQAILRDPALPNSWDGFAIALQGDWEGWEGGLSNAEPSKTMAAVQNAIEAVLEEFNIDRNRVIAHGLSNGGKAIWDLINRRPDLMTAGLPMSAVGNNSFFETIGHMPIWQFQGENDSNPPVSASRSLKAHFDNNGGNYRYTEYEGVGHGTWFIAYAETDFFPWMKAQDQRNVQVFFGENDIPTAGGSVTLGIAPMHKEYEWYLNGVLIPGATSNRYTAEFGGTYQVRWKRFNDEWETSYDVILTGPVPNTAPVVDAGVDQEITLPTNTVTLTGTASDTDGTIVSYAWSQISGPNTATLATTDQSSTQAQNLEAGTYEFRLTATDDLSLSNFDEISIVVNPDPNVNDAPTVNAGEDISITLPTQSVSISGSATDADGTIASLIWTQISGPNSAALTNANTADLTAENLIEGIYVFRLTAQDDDDAYAVDEITVTVNPEGITLGGEPIFRLNVGGTNVSDDEMDWSQDKRNGDHEHFTGNSLSTSWNGCGLFDETNNSTDAPDLIFCPYRIQPTWGAITYSFPLANGTYVLDLYFAERNYEENAARVFDVLVEGQTAFDDFDIHAEAGKNVAVKKTITINVIDGNLDIALERVIGDPVLNGIQISAAGEIGNQAPVVNAGVDQTFALPTNSAVLTAIASDVDGTVESYQWSQVSGPTATLTGTDQSEATISSLVEGTYVFKVIVIDNEGEVAEDEVSVTVNPEVVGQATIIYRVNAGGSAITDDPMDWSTDQDGNASVHLLSNKTKTTGWNYNNTNHTTEAPGQIFGTNRYQPSWGDKISYGFPVTNGTHDIRLYFAEKPFTNVAAGARQFDIQIEGATVASNYDIVGAVGSGGDMKEYQVIIEDGVLNILLDGQVGFPIISGIEILSYVGTPPPPVEVKNIQDLKLSLYPNPATNNLHLVYAIGEGDEVVSIKVFDQAMRVVSTLRKQINPGESHVEIDVSTLTPGMYLINLSTDSYPRQIGRVIKE